MRLNTSAAASIAATKPTLDIAKPALDIAKPALETKPGSIGHGIVAGGCVHPPKPDLFERADGTSKTQGRQLNDIADGVRNGSITSQEAEKLLKQQQEIATAQQQAKADGKVTKEEARELRMLQARAELSIYGATKNGERDMFAPFDSNAQRQADQLERLGNGRSSGNITTAESSKLLGQQVGIADARGDADSPLETAALDGKLDAADKDISLHSRPGTQFGGVIIPHPLPFPRPLPLPFPRPELPQPLPFPRPPLDTLPLPRPELPRFPRPDFEALPFPRGVING